jgi:hypothetical protein
VIVRVTAHGSGEHQFTIRTDNLNMPETSRNLDLRGSAAIEWHGHIKDRDSPWVAVIVPDGTLDDKQEISGFER